MEIRTQIEKFAMLLRKHQFDIVQKVLEFHLGDEYADEEIKHVQKVFESRASLDFAVRYKGVFLGVVNHNMESKNLVIRFLWNTPPPEQSNFEPGGVVNKQTNIEGEPEQVISNRNKPKKDENK